MGDFDWMDAPPKKRLPAVVPKASGTKNLTAVIEGDSQPPPIGKVMTTAARIEFVSCWRRLSQRQKRYLHYMYETGFNAKLALSRLNAFELRPIKAVSVKNWLKRVEYKLVLTAIRAQLRAEVVDKDQLMLNAEQIRQLALEPKPILHKGEDTGFKEVQLDTALRANEQLMKTQKMLGNDADIGGGGNFGPPLIIQVVQQNGEVVDVTPRGVLPELPAPDKSDA